jgi:MerR family transcriptional regulator, heat shock protein HspR
VAELAQALKSQADRTDARAQLGSRIFAAGSGGEIVAVRPGERPPRFGSASQALVLWQPLPSIRR